MKLLEMDSGAATVQLTKKDLSILVNAINESREAIEEWEFATRVGADPAEAEDLREKLKELLIKMKNGRTE